MQYKDLGKVVITDGGVYDATKSYEVATIVKDADNSIYITKKDVPAGISISNTEYFTLLVKNDVMIYDLSQYVLIGEEHDIPSEYDFRLNLTEQEFTNYTSKICKGKNVILDYNGDTYKAMNGYIMSDRFEVHSEAPICTFVSTMQYGMDNNTFAISISGYTLVNIYFYNNALYGKFFEL